ncbi:hypothetical protein B0H10DRAFT_2140146 [Mycena sp. CBHHK59/15]|nr:hypothetical protein B0H10DRAFT_2140146 [Mycena sp. CBHHK59/15]
MDTFAISLARFGLKCYLLRLQVAIFMSPQSIEAAPPPTYSFNGDTSSSSSSPPSEDLVSAQSHPSSDAYAREHQETELDNVVPQPSELPSPIPPSSNQYYRHPFPPQQHLVSHPTITATPSDRDYIPAFPDIEDHKLQQQRLLLQGATQTSFRSPNSAPAPQPKLNPTNFVSVFRKTHKRAFSFSRANASIKGTFAVNPFLAIPAALLAPLARGESARKNLLLKVENGGIDVDVHLIGEPPESHDVHPPVVRTELHLELCGGTENNAFPLIAKIHTPTLRRPPFRLTLAAQNGFLSLHLPLSFHGLLTVRVRAGDLNSHITLSSALGAHATILSEDSTSRAYFVGEMETGRWEGDVAEIGFSGGVERDLDGMRRVGWQLMGF